MKLIRITESADLTPSKEDLNDLKWNMKHTIDEIADYEDNGLQVRLTGSNKGVKVIYRVIDGLNPHEQHAYTKIFPTAEDVEKFIEEFEDKDLDEYTLYEIADQLGFKEVD